jgi:hypothetical protein
LLHGTDSSLGLLHARLNSKSYASHGEGVHARRNRRDAAFP